MRCGNSRRIMLLNNDMKNLFTFFIIFQLPLFGMEVTFFNVGQGNCTLVTCPGQKTMLVDAGYSKAPMDDAHCNTIVKNIIEKIKANAPKKQLFIVASHADKDHISLLTRICEPLLNDKFSFELLLGGTPAFYGKEDGKALLKFLEKNKKKCKTTFASDITGNDHAKQFADLVPSYAKILSAITSSDKKLDPNDTSIIVKVCDGTLSALLPGDATGNVTSPLIKAKSISLLSTIYELSHHGAESHQATTLPLLRAINPRVIVLSSGLFPGNFMHPRFETIKTAVEFCVKKNRTNAQPHMLTYQHANGIPPYKGETDETRFNLVAVNDDGFCSAQTTFPIYHTADLGTITCSAQGVDLDTKNNVQEPGLKALVDIQTPRFDGIRFLFLNNINIESAELKEHLTTFPNALEYMDLRNNLIGHIGIEHLIKLYKNHKGNLIIKLSDNREVAKTALSTICKKKEIKAITASNRICATFTKKGKAKDTLESLEFYQGHNGNSPAQHAQAKAYAQDNNSELDDAHNNKVETIVVETTKAKKKKETIVVHELSHDEENLYITPTVTNQNDYHWPGIIDVCLLADSIQTVAGITTKKRSFLFDFKNNLNKSLQGRFRYTNPTKPWKTIGKEFWSLDEPGTDYYHERSPFSKNGKFVITVSAKNKCINIYQLDPLVFDVDHVKLHKSISEEDLKSDLSHKIADIKRISFTDNDHSLKLHFTDKTSGELRYILEPKKL